MVLSPPFGLLYLVRKVEQRCYWLWGGVGGIFVGSKGSNAFGLLFWALCLNANFMVKFIFFHLFFAVGVWCAGGKRAPPGWG